MENFKAVTNPLLLKNNALKTKFISNSVAVQAPFYQREVILPIEKTVQDVSQLFLKFDVTTDAFDEGFDADFFAFKLSQDIFFETSQKLNLMHIKPEYHIYKYEQTSSTGLYDQIQKISGMPISFNNLLDDAGDPALFTSGSCSVIIPLFLFFSMPGGTHISVRNLEQMQIRIIINTKEAIGMLNDDPLLLGINSLSVSLITESYNKERSELNQFQNGPSKIQIPQSIQNSYNVFYEDVQTLPIGATSCKLLLRCPYPCVNLIGTIYYQNTRVPITKYSIKVRNSYIVGGPNENEAIDAATSFDLANPQVAYNSVEYLEHFFNKENYIFSNTGLTTFSGEDSYFPTYLTIYFDALITASEFRCFEEYITDHKIDSFRKVIDNSTDSYLSKPNSIMAV